ncbi:DUF2690 domain-containing protein [Kitasatospora sp. NPDC059160]|uniref:DUF2690 domain-containing protein n=1 Tax=Kitasatospora sp. NPDC059160 TaxID=3346748 RepID=UPI003684EAED
MSQSWKPLPDDLSEPARRLVEELRAVKDAHRISLAELGRLTYLSKASWERWLNGKRLITSQALAGLIAALDCDAVLLTSLLRQAEAARDAEATPGAPAAVAPAAVAPTEAAPTAAAEPAVVPVPVPVPLPVPLPVPVSLPVARVALWRRPQALVAVAAVAVLLLVAGLYLHGLNGDGGAAASPGHVPALIEPTAPIAPPAVSTGALPPQLCQSVGCAGKDPQAMGCEADDQTVLTGTIGKVVLYLHYSARCRAAWAGITDGSPGDSATISTGTGGHETALIHWGYDNYSKMVDADAPNTVLRVCGHQKDGEDCTLPLSGAAARAQALATTPSPTPTPTPTPTLVPTVTPSS